MAEPARDLGARVLRPRRTKLSHALAMVWGYEAPPELVSPARVQLWTQSLGRGCPAHYYPEHRCPVCAKALRDPAATWEALAARGVIPAEWVQSESRLFADDTTEATKRGAVLFEFSAHPPTVAACVAVSADVPGILAAEELARAFHHSAPARRGTSDRIIWRAASARDLDTAEQRRTLCDESRRLHRAVRELGYAIDCFVESGVVLLYPPLDGDQK